MSCARTVPLNRDANQRPVIRRLAEQLGVHPEPLRTWIRQDQADRGKRTDTNTAETEELHRLRRENAELRRANEILKAASPFSLDAILSAVAHARDRSGVACVLRPRHRLVAVLRLARPRTGSVAMAAG
jgi:transposase